MRISKTSFEGLLTIEPDVYHDSRGFFFESYNKKRLQDAGVEIDFVQDNQSHSIRNVIRGLHFQRAPYAQTKLMRILYGTILDAVVDLRKDQPTFGKVFMLEMSAESRIQLLIPRGFAHGFSVMSAEAGIQYKCEAYYHPEAAAGIRYDDPDLAINWKVNKSEALLSPKDLTLPTWKESILQGAMV